MDVQKHGEQIEEEVFEWFKRRFPEGPCWQNPDFHCFAGVPLELQMTAALNTLEYNIGNGGWAQLLWNCFGTWRELLAICEGGYLLISAKEQAATITRLRKEMEVAEDECREFMRLADEEDDFSYFGKFTARSYAVPGNDWEKCFYWDSGIVELRYAWLSEHAALIQKLMKT